MYWERLFTDYSYCDGRSDGYEAKDEDGEEKELLTALIVAQMKKSYMIWNRTVADNAKIDDYNDVVLKQLDILSGGRLKEGELKLEVNSFLNRPIDMLRSNGNNKKKKRKKNPQQKRS